MYKKFIGSDRSGGEVLIEDSKVEIKKKTIDLAGEVIAADTEKGTGKLVVFENNHIMEDIYSFELVSGLSSRKLFKETFLNEVKITCLKAPILDFIEEEDKNLEDFCLKVCSIELL